MSRRRKGIECTHPVPDDHSDVENGKRIWRCTACGKRERWGKGWGYFGTLECFRCGHAGVDVVCCSDDCRATLKGAA